jgi:hypothetical protein
MPLKQKNKKPLPFLALLMAILLVIYSVYAVSSIFVIFFISKPESLFAPQIFQPLYLFAATLVVMTALFPITTWNRWRIPQVTYLGIYIPLIVLVISSLFFSFSLGVAGYSPESYPRCNSGEEKYAVINRNKSSQLSKRQGWYLNRTDAIIGQSFDSKNEKYIFLNSEMKKEEIKEVMDCFGQKQMIVYSTGMKGAACALTNPNNNPNFPQCSDKVKAETGA